MIFRDDKGIHITLYGRENEGDSEAMYSGGLLVQILDVNVLRVIEILSWSIIKNMNISSIT